MSQFDKKNGRGQTKNIQTLDESGDQPKENLNEQQQQEQQGQEPTAPQESIGQAAGGEGQEEFGDSETAREEVKDDEPEAKGDEVVIPDSAQATATAPAEEPTSDELFYPDNRVNLRAVEARLGLEARTILHRIEEYMRVMAPGNPVTLAVGANQQVLLFRAILQLINHLEGEEFALLFAVLLALFAEHRDGVFHPSAVFRYPEYVKLSKEERDTQQALINMLVKLGPVETRAVMIKQLDMSRTIQHGLSERGRNKIASFFNI